MNNFAQTSPFLRTSRNFPTDINQLSVEIDRSYVDIANAVNSRIIGLYVNNRSVVTGESYFITSARQQTLRKVFSFTNTSSITHNIQVTDPNQWSCCYGNYNDGTNGYGLIWGTNLAIPNQISFYVTSTQIVFVVDAGAPALTSGRIVLEWLSNP